MSAATTQTHGPHYTDGVNADEMPLPRFSGEWERKRLEDIVSIRNQKVLPSNVSPNTPCVELDHIGSGNGRLLKYATAENSTSSKYCFSAGDVLFGRLRSYLRKFWHADKDGICTTEIWPLMVDSEQMDSGFLYAIVQSEKFIAMSSVSYGTHMPRADWGVMRNFAVNLPKIKEQRAIAEVLSDVDGLIGALDALISKKRGIKMAAMQQLLTGRTRLPGFSGAWQEMRVGDLFDAKAGGDLVQSRFSDVQDNRYPYPIYANGLEQQGLYGFSNYAEEPAGAITVTARGTLGKAFHRTTPFVAIGRLLVLKPKVSIDTRFFCEYINYSIRFAVESTGVPQLTAPQVSHYLLPVPPESEQCAIASVLSDMDAEIAALEERRDKTRAIKHGMMQQLLTGRARLLKSE